MSEVIPTIEVMPMTTPRMVRAERSLLPLIVSRAMRTTSPASDLFTAQCLDGVEPRRARGGIEPEEEAHGGGDGDAEHHGPGLHAGLERGERGDERGGHRAEEKAHQPPEDRQ